MLISHQKRFDEFCANLAETAQKTGAPLAFDTEFMSEKRYYAQLCLVQVFMPGEDALEGAIDPFDLDLRPLLDLIADPTLEKIVHSGQADLQILYSAFDCVAQNVFDTQIAAAFLGFGHQIGYADLVRKKTGVALSKTMQYSDWAARPLSAEQVDYALADVWHLPPLHAALKGELIERNRLKWAETEFRRAETKPTLEREDAELYHKLNLSGLGRKQLAVLRELAIVRENMARDKDKPPSFIMPDLALLQMAKLAPTNAAQVRAIRGMPNHSSDQIHQFLDGVETALALPHDQWPPARSGERPDPRQDSVVALLGLIASARATAHDVSRTYLAPREQLIELASWWLEHEGDASAHPPDLPLLHDWRGELLGRDLVHLLNGELAVVMNPITGLPELTKEKEREKRKEKREI